MTQRINRLGCTKTKVMLLPGIPCLAQGPLLHQFPTAGFSTCHTQPAVPISSAKSPEHLSPMPPTGSKEPSPQGVGRGWNSGRCGSPPPAIPHHLKQSLLLQINALHYVCGTAAFPPPARLPSGPRSLSTLAEVTMQHNSVSQHTARCCSSVCPMAGRAGAPGKAATMLQAQARPQPSPEMMLSWKGERAALASWPVCARLVQLTTSPSAC